MELHGVTCYSAEVPFLLRCQLFVSLCESGALITELKGKPHVIYKIHCIKLFV